MLHDGGIDDVLGATPIHTGSEPSTAILLLFDLDGLIDLQWICLVFVLHFAIIYGRISQLHFLVLLLLSPVLVKGNLTQIHGSAGDGPIYHALDILLVLAHRSSC